MDKFDCIYAIKDMLQGSTGINFQYKIFKVLSPYYKKIGKKYEMPSYYGGDDKNDGWVEEDALFYQIYSPISHKNSLSQDIKNKFKEDLNGLIDKISIGKWNGKINRYIFIVNTFDNQLPKDPDRFYENVVKEISEKYGFEFEHEVCNVDYIVDLLEDVDDIDLLIKIASSLRVKNPAIISSVNEKILIDLIEDINHNIGLKQININAAVDYKKISTIDKIILNELEDIEDELENYLNNLDIVESAVTIINEDIMSEDKFERVLNLVVSKYESLSTSYRGVQLFNNLCESIQEYSPGKGFTEVPTKLLIVYIFDKCDIFKKE